MSKARDDEDMPKVDEVVAYMRVPEHTFLEAKEYLEMFIESLVADKVREAGLRGRIDEITPFTANGADGRHYASQRKTELEAQLQNKDK